MANAFSAQGRTFRHMGSVLLATFLCGCHPAGQQAPSAPPPQDVGVVTLKPEKVTLTTDLPGRTSPHQIADIRPQVSGVLQKRLFVEGDVVHAGQQLYQIDPALYQAAVDSAVATLDHAKAGLATAKLLADRDKAMLATNAVAKQDYDNAVASEKQAEADVEAGEAAVETAQVNLVYTKVLSPITGRTGRSVTVGALLTANQSTVLVSVQELDPIYVDIPESTTVMLRLKRELESGQITNSSGEEAPVTLTLEDGSTYDQPGQLKFAEVTVDQGTGSVILRAEFPNPKQVLLPGMFVTAHLQEGTVDNAIMAPQVGITHNQRGEPTAMVVGPDNKVELRMIKTSRAIGDKWLVTDGLQAGDRLIVDGLQKARPGATVKPTEMPEATAAPAPGESAGAKP